MQFQGKRFQRWKRARTTSLNAFVAKDLQEAILGRRLRGRLSPTRSSDPQPIGLVFQKPLQPSGGQPYAIWNPEPGKRKTQSRFPQLVSHMDLTNFTCGKTKAECPWDREVQPPQVEYSLKSTTRSSYQHPLLHPEWIRPQKPSKKGISEEYAAQGIVPSLLPQINRTKRSEFLESLKLSGTSGLRALGECSAKTMGNCIVQQLVEK